MTCAPFDMEGPTETGMTRIRISPRTVPEKTMPEENHDGVEQNGDRFIL